MEQFSHIERTELKEEPAVGQTSALACRALASLMLSNLRKSLGVAQPSTLNHPEYGSLEAGKLKHSVELSLPGFWDRVQVGLMKGKVSSGVGFCWPIVPKWEDRQVCLITC
jgi:hypothetical protein